MNLAFKVYSVLALAQQTSAFFNFGGFPGSSGGGGGGSSCTEAGATCTLRQDIVAVHGLRNLRHLQENGKGVCNDDLACVAVPTSSGSGSGSTSKGDSRIPNIANEFVGEGQMTVPFVGKVPTKYYFDYSGQRQRFDQQTFGATQTIFEFYNEGLKFTVYNGKCKKEKLTGSLYPMSLPPNAQHKGHTTVNGHPVEHWSFKMFMQVDTYVQLSSDGKSDLLRRFTVDTPFIGKMTMDFDTFTPGVQDSDFDQRKLGCEPLVPPPHFTVSGFATDAVTGRPIVGAKITSGSSFHATTDTRGVYTFDSTQLVEGKTLEIKASAPGYSTETVRVTVGHSNIPAGTSADFNLSPVLKKGSFRMVLSWGPVPRDLDSHLLFSKAQSCEVSYRRRVCSGSHGLKATLDRDCTTGFGPETISITDLSAAQGPLRHFVFIYSSDRRQFQGKSIMKLYGSTGLLSTLHVPTGAAGHRYWSTWDLRADGTFATVNKVGASKPTSP